MDRLNKAAAVGIVFFSVMLFGFVGMKVDQTTIALLGGAFIGLVVAIPTTALIMVVGLRKVNAEREPQAPPPTYTPPFPQMQSPHETHNHYHQHNTIYVHVPRSPESYTPFEACTVVAQSMSTSRRRAEELIESGQVKLIEAPK